MMTLREGWSMVPSWTSGCWIRVLCAILFMYLLKGTPNFFASNEHWGSFIWQNYFLPGTYNTWHLQLFFQPSSGFLLLKFYSLLIPPSPLSLLCWEKRSAGKSERTLENEGSSWYWLSWRPPISPPSTQTLNSSALHQNISLYVFNKKWEGSKSQKMFFFRLGLKESNLQIKN